MRVRFRGVRGSVPWSTAESAEAGSNTPCVELSAGSQTLILDAGTGLVGVGEDVEGHRGPITVLLSHYHWDHVQGFPFFKPLFEPGRTTGIVGPVWQLLGAR